METSPIALQAADLLKAQLLLIENPDQRVYIIYDYENKCFDAATEGDLDYFQEIDHDFTILYQVANEV